MEPNPEQITFACCSHGGVVIPPPLWANVSIRPGLRALQSGWNVGPSRHKMMQRLSATPIIHHGLLGI
eukprot:3854794-Amphidinium_carterae.2